MADKLIFCLALVEYATHAHKLNLTYGRARFTDNKADAAISFATMEEYKLFLHSNNINYNEPGYLIKLIEANKNKYSACLDGSAQAFYYRPGFEDGINKFNIYLQGGGWCQGIDNVTCPACGNSCVQRAQHSDRGTSNTDEPYLYFPQSGDGYLSNLQTQNPLTFNWNTVYIRYCDGASFSGNNDSVTESVAVAGYKIYFRGFRNLNAVFQKLTEQYNFGNATDVQLTGSSAGGLATFLHADYIRDNWLSETVQNYIAMPDSGFFMDYEGNGMYDSCMKWNYEYQNTSIALTKQCLNDYGKSDLSWKCMFASVLSPYIKSKTLALQSRFDSYQLNSELRSPQNKNDTIVNMYGTNLTHVFMSEYINTGHAGFLDSCEHHTGKWNDITIDGYNSSDAQVEIWFGNNTHNKLWFQNETYPCQSCCNPST
eukprot:159364_1